MSHRRASTSLSTALISASAGVMVGIVRYLCLKNTCIGDVYLVTLVMFLQVSWRPCLPDAGIKVLRGLHCNHFGLRDMPRLRQSVSFLRDEAC